MLDVNVGGSPTVWMDKSDRSGTIRDDDSPLVEMLREVKRTLGKR